LLQKLRRLIGYGSGFAAIVATGLLLSALLPSVSDAAGSPHTSLDSSVDTSKLVIAPDLPAELAKLRRVRMPFNSMTLSVREREMVQKLVVACRELESIYWRQSDLEGLHLLQGLTTSMQPVDVQLRRLLVYNGSHYDLIKNNAPLVGTTPRRPGAELFPADLSRDEFDRYVAAHPDEKAALYNPSTLVRRRSGALEAVPYHVAYREWLEPAAQALREAAALSEDEAFAKFLRLRAAALLTDDYFASDLAWLDLVNPKVDIIFAPYETYLDDFLGVKTSYGAAILIRNDVESHKLDVYQKYVPDMQNALPLAAQDLPSLKGHATPMEVMDSPLRAGDLRHGYQAVADNLPNDPRVHEQHGSKKIFFKNYMDARVNNVILPIAQHLLRADQAAMVSAEGYLACTILHEISHGLGPAFSRTASGQQDVRAAIGPMYSGLEEAKADIVGLYGLKWLVDKGVVPAEKLNGYYASYVAGIFRTVRFSTAEAHGRAEMMEFNVLAERGVITRDNTAGRYAIDFDAMSDGVAALTKELLEQEATGNRTRTESWFAKYDTMPAELSKALQSASDVPVDIDPVSQFAEPVR
jgi:hypothetical protein